MTIQVPEEVVPKLSSYGRSDLFLPRITVNVDSVAEGSNADKAGLLKGDKFISINGEESRFLDQFISIQKNVSGQLVSLVVERSNKLDTLKAQVDEEGNFGFFRSLGLDELKTEQIKYGFFESIPKGISRGLGFLGTQIKAFGQMGKGNIDVKESVGGPIAIATMFGDVWDWSRFWGLTAALSLILAFMNLLPIPALDGGHVMFLLWEMITGKKPSDKFLEYATLGGFIILMALMVFIFGNDIRRLLSGLIYGIF
jgi:regulator of sigma E protease